MRCKMCSIWKYPSDILKEIKARELEILPSLKFINITGGEPFVRNDLADIIEVAFTKAPRVVISTAGYHVDEILALAERFPQIGIRVSLEGLSTTNDHMRGRDSGFDRGINTLLGLRQMGVKDIGIAMTVSHLNCKDLIPLYELTTNMDMDFATASYHNSFYFHKEDNIVENLSEVSDRFFDLADRLLKEKHPKNWFRAFFNIGLINYINGNRRLLPCEAGTVNFFIEPYGDVYPCNGLEEKYWKKSMGNIREASSFEELWNSDRANEVRDLVNTCPKNCWMVGTAAPVMKKYINHPMKWVAKHKLKSLLGQKIDRSCLPDQYPVGQSPLQGDLRGSESSSHPTGAVLPATEPVRFTTEVVETIPMAKDAFLLRLKRGDYRFLPGQYVSISPHLAYDKSRDYTFCSAPDDSTLDFLIKKVPKGEMSHYLAAAGPGDKFQLVGPYGEFLIGDPAHTEHVFIATGVGIGPFLSFIKAYPELNYRVIHGLRRQADRALTGEVIPEERYTPCITREAGENHFQGRVTDYLAQTQLSPAARYYLCGNPYMLKQARKQLLESGISPDRILTEPYYTY